MRLMRVLADLSETILSFDRGLIAARASDHLERLRVDAAVVHDHPDLIDRSIQPQRRQLACRVLRGPQGTSLTSGGQLGTEPGRRFTAGPWPDEQQNRELGERFGDRLVGEPRNIAAARRRRVLPK